MMALLETIKEYPPFSFLDRRAFRVIETSSEIAYYPNGTLLIDIDENPKNIFLIIKGVVEAHHDELFDIYHEHDSFGGIELIENQPSRYQYLVTEELLCYEIPKENFILLCQMSHEFKAYYFSSIVERMEMLKERNSYSSMSDLMLARVDASILSKACTVSLDTDIIEALRVMDRVNASSLLIENPKGYGIVTDADFRHYILQQEREKLEKIAQLQTYPIVWVREGELLFNVLLLMTEKKIKHLPVLDDNDNLIGVLELIYLLSYFSNQSHLITVQMHNAQSKEAVIESAKRMETMIGALHSKGVKSRYIAKLVSELNRQMYLKLFEFIFPLDWQDRCALVLLGSEGRSEQIVRTDQDNALIFEKGFMPDEIECVTMEFIEALDEIGFPRCKGAVMIINQKWCKGVDVYKKDIDRWIDYPSSEGFMDMAIFYDSMAVAGKKELHATLQNYLIECVHDHSPILAHFALPIESFESPLGLFSQFISDREGIDIKKGGLFALIHGVRALALERGIKETNTTLRIKALNNLGFLSKVDAMELMEARELINSLRLDSQLRQLTRGEEANNYILLESIGKFERDMLKEALKTINRFKKTVSYHFHLDMVG